MIHRSYRGLLSERIRLGVAGWKVIWGRAVREVQTIYGIDFSGAKDAGNKIWITKGGSDGGELVIEECLRARDLPNSGTDIKASLAAIVNLVRSNPKAVFGCD
jgi:hypothetical protein